MPDFSRYKLTPENLTYLDSILSRPQAGSAWSTKTGGPVTPRSNDAVAMSEAGRFDRNNRSMASHNRLVNIGRLASIAPVGFALAPGGIAAAGGLGGGGTSAVTASAPGWSMPGVTAPTFGAPVAAGGATSTVGAGATSGVLSRMGSILGSRGMEAGLNTGMALYGQHSQNKANDQARRDTLAAQAKAIELEEKRLAAEMSNANLDREDARALNAAIQALEGKKFALQQEQAAFERGIYESGEARLQPYRDVSQKALTRMTSILGL